MTRLTTEHIDSINKRLPVLEATYQKATGKSMLEIAHSASRTEYLPLEARRRLKVACIPITAGDGTIGHFSETVAAILRTFADVKAFVTEASDVAGFGEAISRDADLVFLADDNLFLSRNLRTGATSDNGFATGRGFAALLTLSSDTLDEPVLILGSGKVGSGAFHFLKEDGVQLRWYDLKACSNYAMDMQLLEPAWQDTTWHSIIDATTSPQFIGEEHLCAGGIIAAPGVPLGVKESAYQKARIVLHDELETGVMVMFCEAMRHI